MSSAFTHHFYIPSCKGGSRDAKGEGRHLPHVLRQGEMEGGRGGVKAKCRKRGGGRTSQRHMQEVLWTPERSRERGSIDTREVGGLTTSGGAEGSQGPHASALHAEKPPVWLLCAVWMSQGTCRGSTEPVTGRECSSQLSVETSCVTNCPNTQWLRTAIIYSHGPKVSRGLEDLDWAWLEGL